MLHGGTTLEDALGKVEEARPEEGSELALSDVTMFETVFEVPMEAARAQVPEVLDMEFPASVRLALWEWPLEPGNLSSPRNRLAEIRASARKGAVRLTWPVASVYEGDPATRDALRAAGVSLVEGQNRLEVYHDLSVATFEGGRAGAVRCEMKMISEIHPAGLQWNIASLLCPVEAGAAGTTAGFGLSAVRHTFASLRTGRPRVAGGHIELADGPLPVGGPIGGLVARGEVRIGPLAKLPA